MDIRQSIKNGVIHNAYIIEAPSTFNKDKYIKEIVKLIFLSDISQDTDTIVKKQIDEKSHVDVIYVQADVSEKTKTRRKTIKVEDIENFIFEMEKTPLIADRKIGIVEDAEYMTIFAANSLLKTLEEPQENVSIFLICENVQMLPVTIRSRCIMIRPDFISDELSNEERTIAIKLINYNNEKSWGYSEIFNEIRNYRNHPHKAYDLIDTLEFLYWEEIKKKKSGENIGFISRAVEICEECRRDIQSNVKADVALKKMLINIDLLN